MTNIEVLYNNNNILFTRIGKLYNLRCFGASASNLTTALNAISQYFPSNVNDVGYTNNNGVQYLAYFTISGGTNYSVQVTGTYGNAPSNFFSTTHSFYCNIMWLK